MPQSVCVFVCCSYEWSPRVPTPAHEQQQPTHWCGRTRHQRTVSVCVVEQLRLQSVTELMMLLCCFPDNLFDVFDECVMLLLCLQDPTDVGGAERTHRVCVLSAQSGGQCGEPGPLGEDGASPGGETHPPACRPHMQLSVFVTKDVMTSESHCKMLIARYVF